jgi:hypothetical protein
MFTALHRQPTEYDAPAPFSMPSYKSVMGDFNNVRLHSPTFPFFALSSLVAVTRSRQTVGVQCKQEQAANKRLRV